MAPITMLGTMPSAMNFAYMDPWAPSPMMPSLTLPDMWFSESCVTVEG